MRPPTEGGYRASPAGCARSHRGQYGRAGGQRRRPTAPRISVAISVATSASGNPRAEGLSPWMILRSRRNASGRARSN